MTHSHPGRVLIIAGSDSGGGAGIQADIKTVTALGGYAATAITATTAQDTVDVHGVHMIPPDMVAQQIRVVLNDIGADCIKTGMLGSRETVAAVSRTIAESGFRGPIVVDPVIVAKGGARLLDLEAEAEVKRTLFPLATLLTPNIPEAEALGTQTIGSVEDMEAAALSLQTMGPQAVLLKGGHLSGSACVDVLAAGGTTERFEGPRLETKATHGTGCTLASAAAAGLAQGLALRDAVMRAKAYVLDAMRHAPGFGQGAGPMNHAFACGFSQGS